jgi:lambda family phage portal protein
MSYEYSIKVIPKTRIIRGDFNPSAKIVRDVTLSQSKGASHLHKRAYDSAKRSRLTSDFNPGITMIDRDIYAAYPNITNRARELVQNDPFAKRAIRLYQVNIVGPYGFRLEIEIEDASFLEQQDTKIIQNAMKDWGRKENCTVTGRMSFRAVQRLAIQQAAIDGEAIVRKVRGKQFKYGVALQPLETDMIDTMWNQKLDKGAFIRMGIECDQWRKPVAYWLKQWDPSVEIYGMGLPHGNRLRIPAEEIIHYFDPQRAFQTRGVTWFAQTLIRMHHLSKFDESTLIAARAGADKMGFLKRSELSGEYDPDREEEDGSIITQLQPGLIEKLPIGYEFQGFDPKYPDAIQESFTKGNLRGDASGLDLNYHDLSNDYETTTYSSGRLASLTERELWKDHQELFIEHFLDDVYSSVLKEGMISGAIKVPYMFIDKYLSSAVWYGRRWSWIDPLKDITAKILELRAGLGNASETMAEAGGSYDENIKLLAKDKKEADKLGLLLSIFDSSPLSAKAAGAPQTDPQNDPNAQSDAPIKKTTGKATREDILAEMLYIVDLIERSNGTFAAK